MLFTLIALNLAIPSPFAQAAETIYKYHHRIIDSDLNGNRRQCRREGGVFDEYCWAKATDFIRIKENNGRFFVTAETTGHDFDGCHLEGEARREGNQLLVKEEDSGCEATITIKGRSASLDAQGDECQSLCGVRASLVIERARRSR